MTEYLQKRRQVLAAALEVFSRYGFKKTAMQDIAAAAGMSRAALYLHFKNKEDVFRSVSEALHDDVLSAAEAAFRAPAPLSERFGNGLLAFWRGLMEPIQASPHGQEIFDANTALAGDITERAKLRVLALVREAFADAAKAGEIDPASLGSDADSLADMVFAAIDGLKHGDAGLDALERRILLFSKVVLRGLAADAGYRDARGDGS